MAVPRPAKHAFADFAADSLSTGIEEFIFCRIRLRRGGGGVSDGLSSELKFGGFREVIEESDEYAHDGDEGEFLGFAVGHGRS